MKKIIEAVGSKAGYILLFTAIVGLCLEITPFFNFTYPSAPLLHINAAMSVAYLSYFNISWFEYHNFDTGLSSSYLELVFYGIALLGAILYLRKGVKESRLLRFSFAIIFISSILRLAFILIQVAYSLSHNIEFSWDIALLPPLCWICWAFVSYSCLVSLNRQHNTPTPAETSTWVGDVELMQMPATMWQRLFNYLADLIFFLFLFSPLFGLHRNQSWYYVPIFVLLFCYYLFFEGIFNTTPAKMLSQTRVVNLDGSRPSFFKILLRTLCRLIPLYYLSFLFINVLGEPFILCHDLWTKTVVVKEESKGVKGSRYWLIILALALLIGLCAFAHDKYKTYLSYQYDKNSYTEKINEIKYQLQHISSNTIVEIVDVNRPYQSESFFLKVDAIKADTLDCDLITLYSNPLNELLAVGNMYLLSTPVSETDASFEKLTLTRTMLNNSYEESYNKRMKEEFRAANLLGDGRQFEIKAVATIGQPYIKDRGTGGSRCSMSEWNIDLGLENLGWKGTLIEIKNLEGSVVWNNTLPEKIGMPTPNQYYEGQITLSGIVKSNEKYKTQLLIRSETGDIQTYILEGRKTKRTLTRVY